MDLLHALLIAGSAFLLGVLAGRYRVRPPTVVFGKPFYLRTRFGIGMELLVVTSVTRELNRPTTVEAHDYSALLKTGKVDR